MQGSAVHLVCHGIFSKNDIACGSWSNVGLTYSPGRHNRVLEIRIRPGTGQELWSGYREDTV